MAPGCVVLCCVVCVLLCCVVLLRGPHLAAQLPQLLVGGMQLPLQLRLHLPQPLLHQLAAHTNQQTCGGATKTRHSIHAWVPGINLLMICAGHRAESILGVRQTRSRRWMLRLPEQQHAHSIDMVGRLDPPARTRTRDLAVP